MTATSTETRATYVEKAKAQMDKWNAEIDVLQAKADSVKADARAKYSQQITRLREEQHKAETQLKRLRDASEEAWHTLTRGFDEVSASLKEAVANAKRAMESARHGTNS
jgi:chromosome segregation ATPase